MNGQVDQVSLDIEVWIFYYKIGALTLAILPSNLCACMKAKETRTKCPDLNVKAVSELGRKHGTAGV